jgi:hypothetical protein
MTKAVPSQPASERALRRLRLQLALALAVIATVSGAARFAIWLELSSAPLHARTFDIVGRQRMLAKRVIDDTLYFASAPGDAQAPSWLRNEKPGAPGLRKWIG